MSSWTQLDLERLNRSIARGVLTVKYEDRQTTYRSLDEMLKLRDLMREDLEPSGAPSRRRRYARYDKGLR